MESVEKLRELAADINSTEIISHTRFTPPYLFDGDWLDSWHRAFDGACDEIEREIADRYMLKDEAKLDETAVQKYNVVVQVAAGQTIEYNTELRHRCGAATSMSMAFRLE